MNINSQIKENTMTRFVSLSLLALVLATGQAYAHGNKDHHGTTATHQEHAATIGVPGDATKVSRTVEVAMDDTMRFTPSTIKVKRGETIKFVVKNNGKVKHEMVLGTIKELKKHAALMLKFPEMEHADPNQASVEPGNTGEMIWKFTKTGKFDFACLQPGHFEAGMVGKIAVK